MAEGSEPAFALLFRQHAPLLEQRIGRLLKDDWASDEVLQETFIKIWLNREKLTEIDAPAAYFNRIALNTAFDFLNRLAKQQQLVNLLHQQQLASYTIEDSLEYKETQAIIRQAIEELPQQRRAIYELSRNSGLSSTAIAAELGVSSDYVRQAISAARRHIIDKLTRAGKVLVAISGLF